MKSIVILSGLCLLLAGCASQPKPNLSPSEAARINWGERIAKYSYEQAIADLGQPFLLGESSEGRWAEWVLSRSPQISYGFGLGAGSSGRSGASGVGVGTTITPPPSGQYLRLEFGADGQLKEWRKIQH